MVIGFGLREFLHLAWSIVSVYRDPARDLGSVTDAWKRERLRAGKLD